MAIRLSSHAARQANRRGISERIVLQVADNPEQVLQVADDREVRQSVIDFPGSPESMLVRVVVDLRSDGELIVTVYRTSKIAKYWVQP